VNPLVYCPRCGRTQARRGPDSIYWCEHCRGCFDDDPGEGGTYSDRDPSARIERQERLERVKGRNRTARRR
jgi:ribosomal protein L37AE/L43A